MADPLPAESVAPTQALSGVLEIVEPVTSRFPISQIVVPLAETLDWLRTQCAWSRIPDIRDARGRMPR